MTNEPRILERVVEMDGRAGSCDSAQVKVEYDEDGRKLLKCPWCGWHLRLKGGQRPDRCPRCGKGISY